MEKKRKSTIKDLKEINKDLEEKVLFLQDIIDDRDRKIKELYQRSESYKAQVIVYKNLLEKVSDIFFNKILDR